MCVCVEAEAEVEVEVCMRIFGRFEIRQLSRHLKLANRKTKQTQKNQKISLMAAKETALGHRTPRVKRLKTPFQSCQPHSR